MLPEKLEYGCHRQSPMFVCPRVPEDQFMMVMETGKLVLVPE